MSDDEPSAVIEKYGLSHELDDDAALALAQLPKTLAWICDTKRPAEARHEIAQALKLVLLQNAEPCQQKFKGEGSKSLLDAVFSILKEPDDAYDKKDVWGYDKGVQRCAESLAEGLQFLVTIDSGGDMARSLIPFITSFAEGVAAAKLDMKETKPGKGEGPAQVRLSVVNDIISLMPHSGGYGAATSAYPSALLALVEEGGTPSTLKDMARTGMTMVSMNQKELLRPLVPRIFKAVRMGSTDLLFVLLNDTELYQQQPKEVEANLDVLVDLPVDQGATSLLHSVATGGGAAALVPYTPKLIVNSLGKSDHTIFMMSILKEVAGAPGGAQALQPHIPKLYAETSKNPGATHALSDILVHYASLGEAEALDAVQKLLALLEINGQQNQASVLSALMGAGAHFSQEKKEATIGPKMPAIRGIAAGNPSAAQMIQQFNDWYAGRSLASLEGRVNALEEAIRAMNDKISSTCYSFEEVKDYIDSNLAEMKEFMAQIARRLPQPQKLTIIGTVRQTLRLHFVCPRTGTEKMVESKEWHRWLKVGFSALKLGKMVVDAGLGNPQKLMNKGVDVVKEIYNAWKSPADKDFNTYIREPFLTSAEQDKLILGLRNADFFEDFFYDAQAAAWCHNDSMTAADKSAIEARAAPGRDAAVEYERANPLMEAGAAVAAAGMAANTLEVQDEAEGLGNKFCCAMCKPAAVKSQAKGLLS